MPLADMLPPGQYVTQIDKLKVGDTFKNQFGRECRIRYLFLATDGRKIAIFTSESGNDGIQLLNKDWSERRK